MENSDNELSSDDSDFNPEKNQEIGSEDSVNDFDDEPIDSDENAQGNSIKKHKRTKKSGKSKSSSKAASSRAEKESEEPEESNEIDPEEEKRKADAIWAEFLGTETIERNPAAQPKASTIQASSTSIKSKNETEKQTALPTKPAPRDTSQLFEFAGETVEIPSKSDEKVPTASAAPILPAPGLKRPSGGGLSSVLNQLTKKNKLSVLEKTKLDWDGFKSNEGINEELQTHNRGRDG